MKFSYFIQVTVFILFSNICYGQVEIGHYLSPTGIPLNGYYDELDFSLDVDVSKTYKPDDFEKGYYYTKNGTKHTGLLKYHSKKIWFKENEERLNFNGEKLKPYEIKGLVIAQDSFFVINKFILNKPKGRTEIIENEFVQHFTSFGYIQTAIYYDFYNNGIERYYLIKFDNEPVWTSLKDGSDTFKEDLLKYFGDVDHLGEEIKNTKMIDSEIPMMIKTAEYFHKFKNKQPIYYDKWWNEVKSKADATYYVSIGSYTDGIFEFEYYNTENIKFHNVALSSVYPDKKEGWSRWYYNNGTVRKAIRYEDNEAKEHKIYFDNGNLHYHLVTHKKRDPGSNDQVKSLRFDQVNDYQGNSLMDESGSGTEVLTDEFTNRTITRVYNEGNLISSQYEKDGIYINQVCDPFFDMKIKKLRGKFYNAFLGTKFRDSAEKNVQGNILLQLIINEKGVVLEYNVLNSLFDEIDEYYVNFFESNMKSVKFKPYKLNKIKLTYEVIIPVAFNIQRFYRQPSSYNYNWHLHHQHHMMMQNNLNHINPPSFPTF